MPIYFYTHKEQGILWEFDSVINFKSKNIKKEKKNENVYKYFRKNYFFENSKLQYKN